jgi:hypothetical protein
MLFTKSLLAKSRRSPKVFFIGYNKTGTKTLHHFFAANGYKAAHYVGRQHFWSERQPIAVTMAHNLEQGRHLLHRLGRYQVFSDMTFASQSMVIEANAFFREMHKACPDAYFIFNDRPVEGWIKSRSAHANVENGSFIERHAQTLGLTHEATQAAWREQYHRHRADVLAYFADSERFTLFNIEIEGPDRLAEFLRGDFRFDLGKWVHRGSGGSRQLLPGT